MVRLRICEDVTIAADRPYIRCIHPIIAGINPGGRRQNLIVIFVICYLLFIDFSCCGDVGGVGFDEGCGVEEKCGGLLPDRLGYVNLLERH